MKKLQYSEFIKAIYFPESVRIGALVVFFLFGFGLLVWRAFFLWCFLGFGGGFGFLVFLFLLFCFFFSF